MLNCAEQVQLQNVNVSSKFKHGPHVYAPKKTKKNYLKKGGGYKQDVPMAVSHAERFRLQASSLLRTADNVKKRKWPRFSPCFEIFGASLSVPLFSPFPSLLSCLLLFIALAVYLAYRPIHLHSSIPSSTNTITKSQNATTCTEARQWHTLKSHHHGHSPELKQWNEEDEEEERRQYKHHTKDSIISEIGVIHCCFLSVFLSFLHHHC